MPASETRVERPDAARRSASLLARLESFDLVTERLAISVLKLVSWIATIAVVVFGLWKAF